jgi:cell division septum initiation protein DivIVA
MRPTVSESTVDSGQSAIFDLVRRGYDRQQVDDHIRVLVSQLTELRQVHQPVADQLAELQQSHQPLVAQLTELQQAHQREHRRAEWAEGELRGARTQIEQLSEQQGNGSSQQGFGYRVEKLLRTAEQEAADVRSSAAREATTLLERARKDAEAHRHEVEQSLIHRTATLDQEAAQRKVELDERERQIGEQATAARDDSERMLAEVRRQTDQLHQEAVARAEQERTKAEKNIRDRQDSAEQELGRLRGLHDEVRGQLARLLESLANEFGMLPGGYQQVRGPQQPGHDQQGGRTAGPQRMEQNGRVPSPKSRHLDSLGVQQTVAHPPVSLQPPNQPPSPQQNQQQNQQGQRTNGQHPNGQTADGPAEQTRPRPYPSVSGHPTPAHRIAEDGPSGEHDGSPDPHAGG